MGKVITLRRRRDFDRLFTEGRRYYDKLLTTVVLVHAEDRPLRAAWITGRKVGKAVVRNKVRRRLREAGRALFNDIRLPVDVAFVAYPETATATYAQLLAVMGDHLDEAGLLERGKDRPA